MAANEEKGHNFGQEVYLLDLLVRKMNFKEYPEYFVWPISMNKSF